MSTENHEAKTPGLYSKFSVTTRDGKPLGAGSFCLVPFNSDGSVRDAHAVKALEAYSASIGSKEFSEDLAKWLANPSGFNWLNSPR